LSRSIGRVGAAWALVLLLAASTAAGSSGWTTAVHSRPGLRIPKVTVTISESGVAPGYIFVTPRTEYPGRTGPTILDRFGRVVWFHRQSKDLSSQDLRAQVYEGKPVLTWNVRPPLLPEGTALTGNAHNTYIVIADASYRIIKRVRARGRGVVTDTHAFTITGRDSALMLAGRYSRHSNIVDNLVQEIDLKSGHVLYSWSAAHHIPLSETMVKRPQSGAWDPYHLNSVAEDSDGNLLVSARDTSTVYKLDRRTGRIIWKLGGRDSSFRFGRGAEFFYQHDALRQPDGTLTLFDNAQAFGDAHGRGSAAKRLRLDTRSRTATLVAAYRHPVGNVFATSQGNAELLPNGNVFVGWGISPWFSEYASDGRIMFAAHFSSIWHHSFHARKAPWSGHPRDAPAVFARTGAGRVAAYVSWNGATDVAEWRLLGGAAEDAMAPLTSAPWAGFETKLSAPGMPGFVLVEALDASGQVLGRSAVIQPKRS
jgi:Arylsulfotransferase (ASST)